MLALPYVDANAMGLAGMSTFFGSMQAPGLAYEQYASVDFSLRFNETHWALRNDGIDCNGNMGLGYYCHCESQGYACACKKSKVNPEEVKMECIDH